MDVEEKSQWIGVLKDMSYEKGRLQEMLSQGKECSDELQVKMLELSVRIDGLIQRAEEVLLSE